MNSNNALKPELKNLNHDPGKSMKMVAENREKNSQGRKS